MSGLAVKVDMMMTVKLRHRGLSCLGSNNDLIPEGYEAGQQNSSMIQLLYGGLNPGPKASNPNYQAGNYGNTIGGVGDTDVGGMILTGAGPITGRAR